MSLLFFDDLLLVCHIQMKSFCGVLVLNLIFLGRLSFQEKEDIEAQFRDVNEKAEQASSQLSALQQELERTRQQAQEALKAMDMERQQLRSANNKYFLLRT